MKIADVIIDLIAKRNAVRLKFLPDSIFIRMMFYHFMRKWPNLKNPKTFNEKLQWLKINDHNPEYTKMVDKHEAKKYVANQIGEQYIIPTLGVWEKFDDIDFDGLPDRFVLKCTHDSGGVVIVKDKQIFDKVAAKAKIERSLKINYYYSGREWPYKNIKPQIIAEAYMEDTYDSDGLTDFKVYCFSGQPRAIHVISNRYEHGGMTHDYFDLDWVNMGIKRGEYLNSLKKIQKPEQLNEMLELARKLSKNITFLRVDFYVINQKVYFGELTFFPASGFRKFVPESFDVVFGDWITLPRKK